MKRWMILGVSLILSMLTITGCGGNTIESEETTQATVSPTESPAEPVVAESKEEPVVEEQNFTITPIYSGLELEPYSCYDFSMEIPQGWVVESTQTIAGMQHAIRVYDPECPVNQILFILKAEPLYMDETMQYLFSTYGEEWGAFPVLNDVSTEGFFNVFSQYADAIETQPAYSTISLPRIGNVLHRTAAFQYPGNGNRILYGL